MPEAHLKKLRCIIIGASHAGVNCAFALRKEGWTGEILLIDKEIELPYHRPPLSKTFLTSDDEEIAVLKSEESYIKQDISFKPGKTVTRLDSGKKQVVLESGEQFSYDFLVIATGASPIIPEFRGLKSAANVFTLRNLADARKLKSAMKKFEGPKVTVIGGGYIGLEIAASLTKLGAEVTILERESRVLERVTAPAISDFFTYLHQENGVSIWTGKTVVAIEEQNVICEDGSRFASDVIIIGVGIKVDLELAQQAKIAIENGIKVDESCKTTDPYIYAIGDCSSFVSPHYNRTIRLECVQNAVDQAKIAASSICGKEVFYDAIPWFWSDQYDVKLQIVGLSESYDQVIIREEEGMTKSLSVWYFRGDRLIAVDAVNNARAYMLGTQHIKRGDLLDKARIADLSIDLKPGNLIKS